jgi:hypothetical protein
MILARLTILEGNDFQKENLILPTSALLKNFNCPVLSNYVLLIIHTKGE